MKETLVLMVVRDFSGFCIVFFKTTTYNWAPTSCKSTEKGVSKKASVYNDHRCPPCRYTLKKHQTNTSPPKKDRVFQNRCRCVGLALGVYRPRGAPVAIAWSSCFGITIPYHTIPSIFRVSFPVVFREEK